jgi:hypothetical protein
MGLVQISASGRLKLTEDGLQRLTAKGDVPTAQKYNPFSPEAAQRNPFDLPPRD